MNIPLRLSACAYRLILEKWEIIPNRQPPRRQGFTKDEEMRKQVEAMLQAGNIQQSIASFWSQVLLTPIPGNEWQFCVDYRRFNEASESLSWPIPNISDMLQRLRNKQARYFAEMDLTKGYYQAPLGEDSRKYSAFITSGGLYEWNQRSSELFPVTDFENRTSGFYSCYL